MTQYNFGAGVTSAAKGASTGANFGGWGAAIGGALGALGGITGKQSSSRKMYEQAALQHYYWQQQMSTAHQLEAQDLAAAGFNPALTTNSGTAGSGIGSNKIAPSEGKKTNVADQLNGLFESIQQDKVNSANVAETEARTDMIRLQSIAQILTNKNLPEKFKMELAEQASRIANNYANSAEAKSRTKLNQLEIDATDPQKFKDAIINLYKTGKEKGWDADETLMVGLELVADTIFNRR